MNEQKETVFITGASGGIGAATAWRFAHQGHPVALGYYKNGPAAEKLYNALQKKGFKAVLCQGDISEEHEVDAMFQMAEQALGPVMILINNAGHSQQKLFTDITTTEWDRMFAVHVRGNFLCSKRVAPEMIRQKKGCILHVASVWGLCGASCEVHYAAAKAAIIGLTKSLAKELGPSGIRVNCVAPGAIETAMLKNLDDTARVMLCEETPLGRLGTAEEVAASLAFLASKDAAFITGQVLSPNGGLVV